MGEVCPLLGRGVDHQAVEMVVQMGGGATEDDHQIALALVAELMGESLLDHEEITGFDGFGLSPFDRAMVPSADEAEMQIPLAFEETDG